MKNYVLLLVFLYSCMFEGYAQNANSIGGVIKNELGIAIQGVSATISETKNTKNSFATATDEKGKFSFPKLNESASYDLRISMVGYSTQWFNKVIAGTAKGTNFDVVLSTSVTNMEAVVVTALGIKRAEKALGYAAQNLHSEDLNDARANNFVNALSGKVAGLSLISPGSGPLNSVRVSLRGDASLNPNGNNALVVLDGVPMNSSMTSSGVGNAYQAGSGNDVPVDFGNGISDINPDDIENITVLKGPAATALYGSRASSGALIITTKSGVNKHKGIGVTFNSNYSINDVLKWPDYQHEYGQGTGKQFDSAGKK